MHLLFYILVWFSPLTTHFPPRSKIFVILSNVFVFHFVFHFLWFPYRLKGKAPTRKSSRLVKDVPESSGGSYSLRCHKWPRDKPPMRPILLQSKSKYVVYTLQYSHVLNVIWNVLLYIIRLYNIYYLYIIFVVNCTFKSWLKLCFVQS